MELKIAVPLATSPPSSADPAFASMMGAAEEPLQTRVPPLPLPPIESMGVNSPEGDALLEVVPSLLGGLREEAAEEEQIESLLELAQLVDTSFGTRAVRLSQMLSQNGGVSALAALASHPREWLHQTSMLVLGNLASDSSDVEVALKASGHFVRLLPHLASDNPATVTFALGAIRNVCGDADYVGIMQRQGAMRRLQARAPPKPRPRAAAAVCLTPRLDAT